MVGRRAVATWIAWIALMAAATVVMVQMRDAMDQVHVILVYLLLVLGASTAGGRLLAIPLACAGFLLIDFYFQSPFGSITAGKTLDWVALASFLVTAIVATHLLARAQAEAEEADRRAVEIASLARLGSETLSAGRAEDALARIAEVIQTTLGMSECSITPWDGDPTTAASSVAATGIPSAGHKVQRALIPLSVQGRVVGVLRIANAAPVTLDPAQRRFLDAITYYAALGVDRVRLVAEAEHAEALREADRLKDIVLASVSHDLRTPLTTIKALAQSEAMQGNKSAAAIEEQADRLTRLVSDLLDLSRLKGGGYSAIPELNTAEDLIGAAVRQTRGLFGDRPLRTVIDLRSPALVGHFDFSQSLRVLCNLLENAVRYSPVAGSIELAARRENGSLVFTVSDRGPGIDEQDIVRVFEPFYRARSAAPDAGRAGLGLSIARTLAEIQGGSLSYEPRPDGGSVFSLRLPATELRADALEQTA
ncbi:MAG: ATP-binding region ATPase domain protein [Gemmatimonadetes bacterium]|nr:ATP-binding region ATPase domain protein [Gemmatimonadota bacterium]